LKKSSDGKWSGSLSFSLSSELDTPKNSTPGENGAEKRREIPDMIIHSIPFSSRFSIYPIFNSILFLTLIKPKSKFRF
jgi:hypothetical protein